MDSLPSNEIWCRAGARVFLPESIKEYKNENDLCNAIVAALHAGSFKLEGDSYVPEPVISDLHEAGLLGFGLSETGDDDFEAGDIELGDL